jgi:hypothetical protein
MPYVTDPSWTTIVNPPNSSNSAQWQANGNASLTVACANLAASTSQVGNIVTKSAFSMRPFEFNFDMNASGLADGFNVGIYYADQENEFSIGGDGGDLGWENYYNSLNRPAGVGFLCSQWYSNLQVRKRTTHGNNSTVISTVNGLSFTGIHNYKLVANYVSGSTYSFQLLKDGTNILNPTNITLPSRNVNVRFFIAAATGGAYGTWNLNSATLIGGTTPASSVPAKPNTPIFDIYDYYPNVVRTYGYPDNGGSAITNFHSYLYNSANELISDFQYINNGQDPTGLSIVDDVRNYPQFGSLYINYTVTNAIGTSEISDNSLPFVAIPPVENDYFANATLLSGTSISGDNTYSGPEDNEPGSTLHSVWFKWVPNANFVGDAIIHTIGSDFDTYLFIYTGIAIEDLVEIASADEGGGNNTSLVVFTPTPLETYYIRVGGYNDDDYGNYVLNYPDPNPTPSGYRRGYGISR